MERSERTVRGYHYAIVANMMTGLWALGFVACQIGAKVVRSYR